VRPAKPTAADRYDTWDPDWEAKIDAQVRAAGAAHVWDYVRRHPGTTYAELAERLSAAGGFGVAPIQLERLQVRDTPDSELATSLRDSLARQMRRSFRAATWGEGPYWESRALGALVSWSTMWSSRTDVDALKHRLFELKPPPGWRPDDDRDPFLLRLIPD
jgi:hypothetical protein